MRTFGFFGAILVLSVGIAACGDDDSGAPTVPGYDILRGGEEGHCILNDQ